MSTVCIYVIIFIFILLLLCMILFHDTVLFYFLLLVEVWPSFSKEGRVATRTRVATYNTAYAGNHLYLLCICMLLSLIRVNTPRVFEYQI